MFKAFFVPFVNFFSAERELRNLLREITGFSPHKLSYYKLAFTHRSVCSTNSKPPENNERLEYLGDAILDAVVADYLFRIFPGENEGFLTKLRSRIVNGETLSELAIKTGLAQLVKSQTNSLAKKHIYGDAFEALVGAVYLDKGFDSCRYFIIERVIKKYINLKNLQEVETNFKSRLLEWVQKDKKEILFETSQEPDSSVNNPVFISYIRIGNRLAGAGVGSSKKEAEQNAARETLLQIGLIDHKQEVALPS